MTGAGGGPPRFDWGLGRYEHTAAQAASIDDFLRAEFIDHPLGVASRAMLEARGRTDVQAEIIVRAREMLAAANEEADGFAVTRP